MCACLPGSQECPEDDGGTLCARLDRDNDNCGACGNVCQAGESCLGGNCLCDLSTCSSDGGDASCTDVSSDPLNCGVCGHRCKSGENCTLGVCTCQASSTIAQCATDAGLECVDLTMRDGGDPCGSVRGCLCWVDAGTCCGDTCTDLLDPFNCGACGNVCVSGSCILGDAGTGLCNCPYPYSWCGLDCVDSFSDYQHCGGCTPCEPPATECVLGRCQ